MSRETKIMLITIAVILIIIAVGLWWYMFFGKPNPPLTRTNVTVGNASSTTPASSTVSSTAESDSPDVANPTLPEKLLAVDGAKFSVEMATTPLAQTRGLSYRSSLGANDGMLFVFPYTSTQTFWMKDMNFPLDIIWISGTTVVGIAQNVPAPAAGTQIWQLQVYPSPSDTDKVLEVNAGMAAKYNIKVGDTLTIGAL